MHHMGTGVALGRALAPSGIHRRDDGVALDEFPGLHVDPMHPKRFRDLLHIGDGSAGAFTRAGAGDSADIGELSARLGIQRGAVQHQFHPVGDHRVAVRAMRDHRYPLAVDEDSQNPGLRGQFVETGELGRSGVDQLPVGRQVGMRVFACGGVGPGTLALLQHQLVESRLVDRQAGLRGRLEGELDRESVGVVQGKGNLPPSARRGRTTYGLLLEEP